MIGYYSGTGVATSAAAMGFEAPDGVPGVDLDRLLAPVNSFWAAYGGPVLLGLGVLVAAAVCYVIVRVIRRVPVNRLIALLAVGPTLVWTSHGVWNVTVNALEQLMKVGRHGVQFDAKRPVRTRRPDAR